MFWRFLLTFWLGALPTAFAHSMDQAAVLLDFAGSTVRVELQLPVQRLQAVLGVPLAPQTLSEHRERVVGYINGRIGAASLDGRNFEAGQVSSPEFIVVDGAPYVSARLSLTPPQGASSEVFHLFCGVLLDRIPSRVALISIRSDWQTSTFANEPKLVGVLRGNLQFVTVDRTSRHWLRGFKSVFLLGMSHIAEGTDHLLFLLVLLLPAPLLVLGGRWVGQAPVKDCFWKIAKVVTAFTLGHSGTLALGALNLVHAPSQPIEVLIATSILVSAIHALRPLFPEKEALIALGFGLVHGLAFATTLAELGLSRWEQVAAIFSFNLGIEVMQLIVVAAVIPSLIVLSRTDLYSAIRVPGALFASVAAAGWMAERIAGLPNPLEPVVAALAEHALWIAIALAGLAGSLWLIRVKLRPPADSLMRSASGE